MAPIVGLGLPEGRNGLPGMSNSISPLSVATLSGVWANHTRSAFVRGVSVVG
ncbi:hypothetical protein [uncultured Limosilactobacillus sp.]|uniref:hypothetical protein n=1 Tax=uncultured Limosilactobacillus sp. TaxID=2837629 RepID=UPI0025FF4721|nr:hypothetical protein [uncultured Limosilactobacillus sp.]